MSALAAEHELLVTVEEGVLAGGFGSAVWEASTTAARRVPRILRVGLPDRYVDARQARAAARRGRLHRPGDRPAHRGRDRGRHGALASA